MSKVLFLTQAGETLPSVRYRVLPYVELASGRGIQASWRRIPKTLASRLPFFLFLPRADCIVIQKKLMSTMELRLVRRKCSTLAFDIDDALWTSHPNSVREPGTVDRNRKNAARLERVCGAVDVVVAGNRYLADKVRPWSSRVEILPTPLDTDAYTPGPQAPREPGKATVGWMGTSCNLFFLPQVFSALRPLADEIRLSVVSDESCDFPSGLDATFITWSPQREIDCLRSMDIGLMPLTDDEYTRGKCGFKLLQYMACGVVPVASDVGFNREIVTHGRDGLLAKSPREFAECVALLAREPERRAEMAARARQTVVERFSLDAAAPRLWSYLLKG